MKKLYSFFISTLLVSSAVCAGGTDYTKGLAIWFDAPNTLQGHAVWYGGRPDMWKGENKPPVIQLVIRMLHGSHNHCLLEMAV